MVERIKRADVAQMVRAWKGGDIGAGLDNTSHIYSPQRQYCFRNVGRRNVNVGEIVFVVNLWVENYYDSTPVLPQDKFLSAYLNNNIIFVGYSTGTNSGFNMIGVADEPIDKNGGVGYIHFPHQYEFFLAKYMCEANKQAKRLSQSSAQFVISSWGDFRVLATSEENENDHTAYALTFYDPLKGPYTGTWYAGSHRDCEITEGHIHSRSILSNDEVIERSDIEKTMYDFMTHTFYAPVTIVRENGAWVPKPVGNVVSGTIVSTGSSGQKTYQIRKRVTLSPGNVLDYEITVHQDWFASNEILQEGASVLAMRDDSGVWRIVNVSCLQEIE